ncbi:MAG: SPOR domain-containing protein [Duganella sp.]
MGLFSKFGKNKQESAQDSGYYTSADDQGALERARSKRASSGDTPRRRTSEREADDPVLPEKKRARRRLVGAIALALAVAIGLPMVLDSEPKPLASDIDISIPSKDKVADASARAGAPVADSDTLDAKEEIVEDAKLAATTATTAAHAAVKPTDRTVSGLSAQAQAHSDELDRSVAASEARAKAEADARNEQESDRKAELERKREAKAKADAKAAADAERKLAEAKAKARAESERKVAEAKPAEPKPAANVSPKPATENKQAEDARALAILEGKASKPAAAAADSGQKFVLQVAALSDQNKVSELRERLKQAGISSYTQKAPSGEVTRVRVGPFNSKEEAEKVRAKLVGMGLSGRLEPV